MDNMTMSDVLNFTNEISRRDVIIEQLTMKITGLESQLSAVTNQCNLMKQMLLSLDRSTLQNMADAKVFMPILNTFNAPVGQMIANSDSVTSNFDGHER